MRAQIKIDLQAVF